MVHNYLKVLLSEMDVMEPIYRLLCWLEQLNKPTTHLHKTWKWRRKAKFKIETESLQITAENNAIRIN